MKVQRRETTSLIFKLWSLCFNSYSCINFLGAFSDNCQSSEKNPSNLNMVIHA